MNLLYYLLSALSIAPMLISMDSFTEHSKHEKMLENALFELTISPKGVPHNFQEWKARCALLPYYTRIRAANYNFSTVDFATFNTTLEHFFKLSATGPLAQEQCWYPRFCAPYPDSPFFDTTKALFKPFVQKLVVPENSIIAFRGDLHGDIHSLVAYIEFLQHKGHLDPQNAFKIIDPRFYMVFLGDYTDRGIYGVEVICTLWWLKLLNPDRVFLLRGNHEDVGLNAQFGFYEEFFSKFNEVPLFERGEKFMRFSRFYDFLPVALYVCSGTQPTNILLCCHGGLELGFNPQELLAAPESLLFQFILRLDRAAEFKKLQPPLDKRHYCQEFVEDQTVTSNTSPSNIGFLWSDFIVNQETQGILPSTRGGGIYEYGKQPTLSILKQNSTPTHILRGVFRAHQHSNTWTPMMELILLADKEHGHERGLGKLWRTTQNKYKNLWDGIVCTFLVAPDTIFGQPKGEYPGFSYDAFALLTTAPRFEQWHLEVHRNEILKRTEP